MSVKKRRVSQEARLEGFGERAWLKRCELGQSRNEAADLAGIAPAALQRLESGQTTRPYPKTIHKLSEAYGVPVRELLTFSEATSVKEKV